MSGPPELTGPDLAQGIPLAQIPEGELFAAHAFGKPLVVVRRGDSVRALGAQCTHYGGPLAEGLLVDDTVRCPWHHACFSLRTGEATRGPALNPVATWSVERRDGRVFVTKELEPGDGATPLPGRAPAASAPTTIVIVGGGAAGNAAAEMLRREGYGGSITMITADESLPYDRPNLSKDYLAGNAPADWIPLRSADFYKQHRIDVMLGARATALDAVSKQVTLEDGRRLGFDRLLLATGADPVRLKMPGGELPHVHYLRTLGDANRIIDAAKSSRRVVVMGASFIGLEVAASLRTRGLAVHVVAPEKQPLERIMGPEVGAFVRSLHEKKGVVFHLGQSASSVAASSVTLESGEQVAADLVVIGVGVRPALALAEAAGLAMDRGVSVNEFLESSVPGIFAAGDIARWPDPHTGSPIRVEHWVVAERQGQTAARNMLGRHEKFDAVPFFWSAHYDTTITYVGHAEQWTSLTIDGDLSRADATVTMKSAGRTLAVITVGRDRESLRAEVAMEARLTPHSPAPPGTAT
ncbi:MAG: pyridine nucleotide-disulfide oxidoreductase [Acidobacteria bacterium]|nr:MAG: pyridine nucleotide-disulfide oxidoreductase [Acidobacteriota bacterium]